MPDHISRNDKLSFGVGENFYPYGPDSQGPKRTKSFVDPVQRPATVNNFGSISNQKYVLLARFLVRIRFRVTLTLTLTVRA